MQEVGSTGVDAGARSCSNGHDVTAAATALPRDRGQNDWRNSYWQASHPVHDCSIDGWHWSCVIGVSLQCTASSAETCLYTMPMGFGFQGPSCLDHPVSGPDSRANSGSDPAGAE